MVTPSPFPSSILNLSPHWYTHTHRLTVTVFGWLVTSINDSRDSNGEIQTNMRPNQVLYIDYEGDLQQSLPTRVASGFNQFAFSVDLEEVVTTEPPTTTEGTSAPGGGVFSDRILVAIIVAGGIAALVLLLVIVVVCFFVRRRRNQPSRK